MFAIIVAGTVVLGGAVTLFYVTRPPVTTPEPAPRSVPAATPASTPTPASSPTLAAPPPAAKTPASSATPEAAPTTGTLTFESDVPDTGVFLDRVYLGTAPITASDVKPGPHRVNMSASGYEGYAETVDVAPGPRTLSVKFKEVKLDATIAVVHKHAIGSCTGTLHAAPQGLTYDTANKADAFTAALTNLETFTVDYLAKNLRVKIKGGKTYNFTDPDGDVNRLYLFHQDVDKARQRLISGR